MIKGKIIIHFFSTIFLIFITSSGNFPYLYFILKLSQLFIGKHPNAILKINANQFNKSVEFNLY